MNTQPTFKLAPTFIKDVDRKRPDFKGYPPYTKPKDEHLDMSTDDIKQLIDRIRLQSVEFADMLQYLYFLALDEWDVEDEIKDSEDWEGWRVGVTISHHIDHLSRDLQLGFGLANSLLEHSMMYPHQTLLKIK